MKPKRPTETDLLAIVQNGFKEQLPRDREARAPAPPPAPTAVVPSATEPAALVPMARITLAIPEDLRYRLKLAMMDHRRKHRSRITQDDFCAQAIAAHLDKEERGRAMLDGEDSLAVFLRDCLNGKGLTKAWIPKAEALLENVRSGSWDSPPPAGSPSEPRT